MQTISVLILGSVLVRKCVAPVQAFKVANGCSAIRRRSFDASGVRSRRLCIASIRWKDLENVVLVGHSYGGMVITGVAEQVLSKIGSIVYLAAFVPADGESIADLGGKVDAGPFTAPMPAARFAVNEADRAWVDSKMTPQSTACFTEKLKVTGAYQNILRKTYIRAKNFAGFAATLDKVRSDASWKTHVVDCGHDVMIDKPDELTSILMGLI